MSYFKYYKHLESLFKNNGSQVKFKKNRYLVSSLENSQWVFFLEKGIVQAEFTLSNGTERLIGFFLPGMTFAQSGSFFDFNEGDLEYKAKSDVVAYRLQKDLFLQALSKDSEFNTEYIDLLLRNQIYLINRIVYQGAVDLESKFISWIIFMVKFYGQKNTHGYEFLIALNHYEIANMLHTNRVSINKLINKYKRLNIIKIDKHIITVIDYIKLKELVKKI